MKAHYYTASAPLLCTPFRNPGIGVVLLKPIDEFQYLKRHKRISEL